MPTVSMTISDKAQRLIEEGRVRRVNGHIYEVTGDHDKYTVFVSYPQEVVGLCKCKSKVTCSHLLAACAFELARDAETEKAIDWLTNPTDDPFRGLNQCSP